MHGAQGNGHAARVKRWSASGGGLYMFFEQKKKELSPDQCVDLTSR